MIIAAISRQQPVLEKILQFLTKADITHPFFENKDIEKPHTVLTFNGGAEQITVVVEQEHPDLLLYESTVEGTEELSIIDKITTRFPNLGVIMLCPHQSSERLIEAMRVGVREAIPAPLTRETLLNAVHRCQQRFKQVNMPTREGKVLAFIPCKGGSGATFLATNLAYTLAAQERKKVALIDFNLQLGDAALFLSDSNPSVSIADVTRQIHRLDGSFLASSMTSILPNLSILAAPDEPEKATEIKPEHVSPLLQVATKNYDFIILDIGRRLDAVSIQALDKADLIFPVLQQTLPFIRDAKRLVEVFHSLGYGDDKLKLVVNRFDKKSEITLNDVERTLGIPLFKAIPNNYSVVDESVNHGIPVTKLAKRSPVAKAIEEIGSEMSNSTEHGNRWLKKLFAIS